MGQEVLRTLGTVASAADQFLNSLPEENKRRDVKKEGKAPNLG